MKKPKCPDSRTSPPPPSDKIRALANPGSNKGTQRQFMYKCAFSRISAANEAGFYLESITIIESLVSDRLESRLSFLLQQDFSFKNLGELIRESSRQETDPELRTIIKHELNLWRKERNSSLHEMAKIASGDDRAWHEKYATLEEIVSRGHSILAKIQNRMKKLQRASL